MPFMLSPFYFSFRGQVRQVLLFSINLLPVSCKEKDSLLTLFILLPTRCLCVLLPCLFAGPAVLSSDHRRMVEGWLALLCLWYG